MFTYGCDPELFVRKKKTFISAAGLIPGTKEAPFKVDGGAVQVDGMAVEFNIDPVDNVTDWNKNIEKVLGALRDMLPGHELVAIPSITFRQKQWDATPDEAKELGCDPDYNAYSGLENPRPAALGRVRAAGGHIHVGWRNQADIPVTDPLHLQNCRHVVRRLDRYVGYPSLMYDNDVRRRKMYGKAGAFRPKPYGVEYRTLSNFWVLDPEMRSWVFNMVNLAVEESLPNAPKIRRLQSDSTKVEELFGYCRDWYYGLNTGLQKRISRKASPQELYKYFKNSNLPQASKEFNEIERIMTCA
jgi:hypothetical protein